MNIDKSTSRVVNDVFNVLLKVLFSALFTVLLNSNLVCSLTNSLILSKTTTVSFKEYPITVNIENKGTVFIKGTNALDWQWAGVKVKEVDKEEQGNFKIPNL